jgi:hypothetical protein
VLDENQVLLYYNALTNFDTNKVNSDIRMVSSADGVTFGGDTEVLRHDSGCAGCGDEIWPTSVFRSGSKWYFYYSGNLWNIYLATLSSPTTLETTKLALDLGENIISAMAVPLGDTDLAVFLPYQTFSPPWTTHVRATTLSDPAILGEEQVIYDMPALGSHQLYYRDEESQQWLMFYQTTPDNVSETNIGLMTSPL